MEAGSPRYRLEGTERLGGGPRLAKRDLRLFLQQEKTPNGQSYDPGLRELGKLHRPPKGGSEPEVRVRPRKQVSKTRASRQGQERLQRLTDRRWQLPFAIDRNQEIAAERGFH